MTRESLILMVGDEDKANAAIDLILDSIKEGFVETVVHTKIKQIKERIAELENDGYLYTVNGSLHADWGKAKQLDGWNLSEEQQANYNVACNRCRSAENLLCELRFYSSMMSVR